MLESFALSEEEGCVWLFERPIESLEVRTASDLEHLLDRLQQATDSGLYAAGYLAYEAGHFLEAATGPPFASGGSLAWFGLYQEPVRLSVEELISALPDDPFAIRDPVFEWSREQYAGSFRRVRHHIHEGDVYQINLTGRLHFAFHGSALSLYRALLGEQRRVFGAFFRTGTHTILSRSPELFFTRDGRDVVVRPMKGTHARGVSPEEDDRFREALASDPKNRAENLMIVDLLRNDLSVVCEPESVRTSGLFATELHETLIQMTSTVRGRLRKDITWGDLFRALFPSGSVTGAPRIRAMQLIRELEVSPRGAYCGAIGWMGPGNRSVFNVAIRTAEIEQGRGRLGIGSGIVWDSDEKAEYAECLLKARFFLNAAAPQAEAGDDALQLIETMLWDGGIALLQLHLDRLRQSAGILDFMYDEEAVRSAILSATEALQRGRHRVRLLLARDGNVDIATSSLPAPVLRPLRLAIAEHVVHSDDPLVRHKTTRRGMLDRIYEKAASQDIDDVLLRNERGEICEGTRNNVIIRTNGALQTPPVACGLLPGVYRNYLLQTRPDLRENTLTLADLMRADQIFVCNAVWGLREAELMLDHGGRVVVIDAEQEPGRDAARHPATGATRDDIPIPDHS